MSFGAFFITKQTRPKFDDYAINDFLTSLLVEDDAVSESSVSDLSRFIFKSPTQSSRSHVISIRQLLKSTGLMGKTLLELQSNKGEVLPAYKFGTHDVVLKPNKDDLGSPALGHECVVYRLKVLRGDNSSLANDIRKEMKALNSKLLKVKDRNTKKDIRKELKMLSKEKR